MELNNEFRVAVPVDEAWTVLTDVEAIAPCMPGAQLTEIDGDTYHGLVKIKIGPVSLQYKGTATFVEKDEENHKAVLDASGREGRGQGNASAMITAQLTPDGDGTKVVVDTDLKITGPAARFSSQVNSVSKKLIGQFVECLETKLASGELGAAAVESTEAAAATADEAPAAEATPSEPRKIDSPEPEAIDALAVAPPAAKAAAPALLVLLILFFLLRRRKS